jgi:aryl-alcohol dehydrogenase-like predicted oxidoreductase
VRYIGTSTYGAWQLVESLWMAKELGLNRFVCEQPPFNLLDRRIERELMPMARTYGFGIIPWSPLGGGLLTGKYTRNTPAPKDARYADQAPHLQRRYHDAMFDTVEKLQAFAEAKCESLAQIAIAWCLQQPGVTSPIIGPRTMEQFEDNLAALQITLTPEDLAKLDEIAPPGSMVSPYYEADFGPHQYR